MRINLLFAIILIASCSAFAQWVPLNGPTTYSVGFFDSGKYIFAGSSDGVFRSADEGLHWGIIPDIPRHYSFYGFAASLDNTQLVVVMSDDACKCMHYFSSSDQGEHWIKISTPGFAEYVSAVFSGDNGYILTSTSRVHDNKAIHTNWESFDGGKQWRRNYMDTLSDAPIISLHLYGTNIWGYAGNKLFRGTEKGEHWQLVSVSPDSLTIGGYLVSGDTILLNSWGNLYSRLWRSFDGGVSWEELPFQKSIIHFQQYENIRFARDAYGYLISSQDDGENWLVQSVDSIQLLSFLVRGSELIGYEYGTGVVTSEDLGKHFFRTNERLGHASIPDRMTFLGDSLLVTDPFAHTIDQGLPVFDTGEGSWGFSMPPKLHEHGFGILSDDIQELDGRLFVCMGTHETYCSEDKGTTWNSCTNLSLWPDVPTGTRFLAVGHSLFLYSTFWNTHHPLYRTDDYGQTWIDINFSDLSF